MSDEDDGVVVLDPDSDPAMEFAIADEVVTEVICTHCNRPGKQVAYYNPPPSSPEVARDLGWCVTTREPPSHHYPRRWSFCMHVRGGTIFSEESVDRRREARPVEIDRRKPYVR